MKREFENSFGFSSVLCSAQIHENTSQLEPAQMQEVKGKLQAHKNKKRNHCMGNKYLEYLAIGI